MKTLIRHLVFVACLCGAPLLSPGAEPPQGGETARDFTLKTLDEQSVRLKDLTAKQTVVLVVLRGWPGYQCPICDRQVQNFIKVAPKFKEANAKVVFVYPGPAKDLKTHAKEFASWKGKEWPAEFLFVLDPDYTMANAWGLRWNAPKETAYPSTFVIGRDGKVKTAIVSRAHGGRSDPEDILAGLK